MYKTPAFEIPRAYVLELQQPYEMSGVIDRPEKWMEMIHWEPASIRHQSVPTRKNDFLGNPCPGPVFVGKQDSYIRI
ncbi:hypothetical protein AA0115_g8438 [Alternaria tenuissima]|uniref:Uncharacterized protein n=1 Tax=Alternaria tenuissima TaxID=119927 RepID=A0AB37W9N8_9PLEO|nr:hypothetical protein AA0115_g8438 [Alternaria tenuissima]